MRHSSPECYESYSILIAKSAKHKNKQRFPVARELPQLDNVKFVYGQYLSINTPLKFELIFSFNNYYTFVNSS